MDIKFFKETWKEIRDKIDVIADLPRVDGNGEDFMGITIDETGFTYNTRTWYSGCSPDDFSFTIDWEDIDKPIEYFKGMFEKEIEDHKLRELNKKKAAEDEKILKEKQLLSQLKKKYEDLPIQII